MRLFAAIDLEENVKERIMETVTEFQRRDFDVKWTKSENLHITLHFLGEVGESEKEEVVKVLSGIVERSKPFKFSVQGVGYFGSPNFIKVVWVDVKEGEERLIGLMKEIRERLAHVKKDSYPPRAHITIGRVKPGGSSPALKETIEEMKDVKFSECEVKEIKLKQSILESEGPKYTDVKVFKLD